MLANTGEPLYIVNRRGNRPSHEGAAEYLDRAVALSRPAGFRRIKLRGDTDFTQTAHLDGWDEDGVTFIFGIDAMPNLYEIVEKLPRRQWKRLVRRVKQETKTGPRKRPENVKERIVKERKFENVCSGARNPRQPLESVQIRRPPLRRKYDACCKVTYN